jgi:hypothetical protein
MRACGPRARVYKARDVSKRVVVCAVVPRRWRLTGVPPVLCVQDTCARACVVGLFVVACCCASTGGKGAAPEMRVALH